MIAKDIRTIDFSVQTRNRLVEMLKEIDKDFSRVELDLRRAQHGLDRESNAELNAMHKRRIEKYKERRVELEERYNVSHEQVAATIADSPEIFTVTPPALALLYTKSIESPSA